MKAMKIRAMATGLMMVAAPCIAGEIRIRAISLTPGHPADDVYVQDKDGKEPSTRIEVKSFLNHESMTIDYDSNSLVFTSDGKASSLNDKEKELGRVEIPTNLKSGILIFRPGVKDEAPSVKITDDSPKVFPAGATKVINLCTESIRIELEGENFDCDGESELVITDPPVQKNNSSGMRAYRKDGDQWVQVKVGVWPHPGKKRVVRIVSVNPLTKQVEFHSARDISDPTE